MNYATIGLIALLAASPVIAKVSATDLAVAKQEQGDTQTIDLVLNKAREYREALIRHDAPEDQVRRTLADIRFIERRRGSSSLKSLRMTFRVLDALEANVKEHLQSQRKRYCYEDKDIEVIEPQITTTINFEPRNDAPADKAEIYCRAQLDSGVEW